MSHLQQACLSPSSEDTSETEHLQKQLNLKVSSQTSRHEINPPPPQKTYYQDLLAPSEANTKQNNGKPVKQPSSSHKPISKPRPWYCFQCGEDGPSQQPVKVNPTPHWLQLKINNLEKDSSSGKLKIPLQRPNS